MIIAVDGPTASGKGTVAKGLARHFRLPHLDTGLLYRAVGQQVRQMGGDPDDPADALRGCAFADRLLADPALRSEEVGALASRVSVHKRVRAALLDRQRSFARQPGGAVLDGRDIGTVIAPDADAKLFVTAGLPARAMRRFLEMQARGGTASLEAITADLVKRDARDANRAEAPLVQASDAMLLDNSDMSPAEGLATAIALIERRIAEGAAGQAQA